MPTLADLACGAADVGAIIGVGDTCAPVADFACGAVDVLAIIWVLKTLTTFTKLTVGAGDVLTGVIDDGAITCVGLGADARGVCVGVEAQLVCFALDWDFITQ